MSFGAIAFLAGFGLVIVGLMRWMGTTNTDRDGFVELASFVGQGEAARALEVLERARIPSFLDDHTYEHGKRGAWGTSRLLVREERVAEAVRILREQADYVRAQVPPA